MAYSPLFETIYNKYHPSFKSLFERMYFKYHIEPLIKQVLKEVTELNNLISVEQTNQLNASQSNQIQSTEIIFPEDLVNLTPP